MEYKGFEIEIIAMEVSDGTFSGRYIAHSSKPGGIRKTDTTETTYRTIAEAEKAALADAKREIDAL